MFKTIMAKSLLLILALSAAWRINGEDQFTWGNILSTQFGLFYTDGVLNAAATGPEAASVFAYYKMDDYTASYTVLDSSGNNRHATIGETTDNISYPGLDGTSLLSQCTFGGLSVNEAVRGLYDSDFSVSLWIKLGEGFTYTGILTSPGSGNWVVATIYGNGYISWAFGGNGQSAAVSVFPTWHHVVFVRRADTFTVYYDGAEAGSTDTGENFSTASWVWFDPADWNYSPSIVDEVIFYKGALTAQQAIDLYESYDGPTFGTITYDVGYYTFDMGVPGACDIEYSSKLYLEGTEIGAFPAITSNDPRFSFASWVYAGQGDYLYETSPVYDGLVAAANWITVSPASALYFDSQGGSQISEWWELYEGFTFEIPYFGHYFPADPTYEGYVFAGWFNGAEGTGYPITSQTIFESMIFGTGYMYAFAHWTLPPITFTFNSGVPPYSPGTTETDIPGIENYVTYDYTEITYGAGAEITTLPSASVTGPRYTFSGYWYEPYYAVVYQTGSYAPQNNDPFGGPIPLYAMWTDNGYQGQVTFDLQGGTGEVPSDLHLFEGYVFSTGDFGQTVWPAEPTYDGYTFGGWWTDVGGTGNLIEYDTTWNYAVYPLSVTLYAHWIAN